MKSQHFVHDVSCGPNRWGYYSTRFRASQACRRPETACWKVSREQLAFGFRSVVRWTRSQERSFQEAAPSGPSTSA
jgi:hypothetical protein